MSWPFDLICLPLTDKPDYFPTFMKPVIARYPEIVDKVKNLWKQNRISVGGAAVIDCQGQRFCVMAVRAYKENYDARSFITCLDRLHEIVRRDRPLVIAIPPIVSHTQTADRLPRDVAEHYLGDGIDGHNPLIHRTPGHPCLAARRAMGQHLPVEVLNARKRS